MEDEQPTTEQSLSKSRADALKIAEAELDLKQKFFEAQYDTNKKQGEAVEQYLVSVAERKMADFA